MNCTLNTESTTKTESPRTRPIYNVEKTDQSYELRVNVPGSSKEHINISFEKDILTIQATRSINHTEGVQTLRREISNTDYELKLRINIDVDEEKISAKTEDGVLRLTLPIAEAAKPKSITVE